VLSKVTFTPAVGSAVDLHAASGNYKVSRAEGIVGPPSPRDVSRVAPGRDGSLDDTRFLNERNIVLEGEIIGSSQSDVLTKWDALAAAFQSTMLSKGTLTVTLPDGTTQRQTSVVLSGAAQPAFEGGSNYLQYQVNFRAPDPRWYGTTQNTSALSITTNNTSLVTSSSSTMTNSGNAPSNPIFTFTYSSGSTLVLASVDVNVPSSYSSLSPQGSLISLTGGSGVLVANNGYVDCGKRKVSNINFVSPTTEWPLLYPGSSSWSWKLSNNSLGVVYTCTASWYDAWW
jgi:hypothetical protein